MTHFIFPTDVAVLFPPDDVVLNTRVVAVTLLSGIIFTLSVIKRSLLRPNAAFRQDKTAHSRPRGERLLLLIAMWKHHTLHVFQQKQKGSEPLSSAVKSRLILKEKLLLLVGNDQNASPENATGSCHFWQLFDINARQNRFRSLDFTDSFN